MTTKAPKKIDDCPLTALQIAPFRSYWFGEKWCPAVYRDGDGYSVRVGWQTANGWKYDYFKLDADGVVQSSPRGYARSYNRTVRITDIAEVAERMSVPDPSANENYECTNEDMVKRALLLLADPEPAEPLPGVYRDGQGVIWHRADEGPWYAVGSEASFAWAQVRDYGCRKLTRLWSAAELIPDPDDRDALIGLCAEIEHDAQDRDRYSPPAEHIAVVCRVLRARAESRIGAPEASNGR